MSESSLSKRGYEYFKNEGIIAGIHQAVMYASRRLLPSKLVSLVFIITHWIVPKYGFVLFSKENGFYKIKNYSADSVLYSLTFPSEIRLRFVALGYKKEMIDRYSLDQFVEVEEGDTVVDVGAFIGTYSIAVCNTASSVISFEPSSENFKTLKKNTENISNIDCFRNLISDKNKTIELFLAKEINDHSIIEPDNDTVGKECVQSIRLDDANMVPDTIDLLKIDAEGAEPEVIRGCENTQVKKMAVDCSAERYGETTVDTVKELLEDRGMTVRQKGTYVYATNSD